MDRDDEFHESVSHSCAENTNIKLSNIGVFECNICLDLAQDPVVTLCGHLFCWPCLYKWLQFHSYSHECPVCKALVDDHNLVPIYGRGTSGSDPRAHPLSRDDIPSRPASQRPQTAPALDLTYFRRDGSGASGWFMPRATARLGDWTSGHYMLSSYAHGSYVHGFHHYPIHVQGTKLVFLTICFLLVFLLLL